MKLDDIKVDIRVGTMRAVAPLHPLVAGKHAEVARSAE